jgi:hypothetical protein
MRPSRLLKNRGELAISQTSQNPVSDQVASTDNTPRISFDQMAFLGTE